MLTTAGRTGGRLVFVGGEAGVGKTALVRAFADGWSGKVLQGSCESLAAPVPFGPLVDLAPQAGEPLAEAISAEGADPRRVGHALLALLAEPVVIVLEDVHWADGATLDALRIVGRRVDGTKGLVVATYRDDEVGARHPLRLLLGELATAHGVSRLAVPPLSTVAVHTLAAQSGADADAIHRLTGGNAFYVTEILAGGEAPLPESVRDAVLARASPLGLDARRLLDAAALVPSRCELWLLEAVDPGGLEALDSCLASGMLCERGDGVAFRHELARMAIESAVPVSTRRRLHAAILAALEAAPHGASEPARLAHHAELAGDGAAALAHAQVAARRASAAAAHREAAHQYARAIHFAGGLGDPERAALLDAYAFELQLTGEAEAAVVAWEESASLFRASGDRSREAQSLTWLTRACIPAGRNAEAEAASMSAIEILESIEPGPALGRAYATQSYVRMLARDNAEGVAWGSRAVEVAERYGDDETRVYALSLVGTSHLMAGDVEIGVDFLERSIAFARERNLWVWVGPALINLGSGLGEMYELERAESALHEALRWVDEQDLAPYYSRSWMALVHAYLGRWDEAAAAALDVDATAPDSISRISALIALGRVRARRGDPGASAVLDRALELARPGGHLQRLGHVYAARAEAAALVGDETRAADEASMAYELAVAKRHVWFAGELAYWQIRAGALPSWPSWIAEPWRLQLAGDALGAAAAWEARGCPYEAARALADSDEVRHVRTALDVFERMGAVPAAKAARSRLRHLGAPVPRGPRPSTRANPASLTAREVGVLRLMAVGRRNAEIAAELVVSPRTVDRHVSSILRKLGARSRGEAAVRAVELGLLAER